MSRKQLGQKSSESPLGPVPFQGIGTRLRRSRSKDHSNELDNLSTSHLFHPHQQQTNGPPGMEIANLTRTQHSSSRTNVASSYDQHSNNSFGLPNFTNKGTGTLERPKRLMTAYGNGGFPSSESSTFIQQPLYGGTRNIYEETRLLGHQYEEPHLVMDRDLLYDTNPAGYGRRRNGGKQQQTDSYLQNGGGKHYSGSNNHQRVPPLPLEHCPPDLAAAYHSYMVLDGVTGTNGNGTLSRGPNTTVIPPSKLFGKSLSTSYNANNGRLETASKASEGLEYSPKSTATSSSMSSTITSGGGRQQSMLMTNNSANNANSANSSSRQQPKELACGNESDSSTTKADSGLQLLTRTSHELSTSSSSGGENGGTHHHNHHHIDRTFHDQDTEPAVDSPPTKLSSGSHHHLTSSSQSSVMHTYANPFQNGCPGGGGSGGSPYSEDTTGPIIPDMNTLRPSQLLKNSFAGSGPPPGLHSGSLAAAAAASSSSANHHRTPNVISYLSNLLSSAMGGPGSGSGVGGHHPGLHHPHHFQDQKSADSGGGLSKHRCTWRRSTLLLLILVFILFLVIILLCALSSAPENNGGNSLQGRFSELNPKVPCIVVEDLDTSSANFASASSFSNSFDRSTSDYFPGDSSHRSSSSSSSSSSDQLPSNHCPLSFPRDPSYFKEIRLPPSESGSSSSSYHPHHHHQQQQPPMSQRLAPLTSWTVWFTITEANSYVNFQFYAPLHARFVLLAAKNEPPTLTTHQIFQVISDEALAKSTAESTSRHRLQRRSPAPAAAGHREAQLLQLQSTHYFEPSTWYLTLLNDLDYTVPLVVNISTTTTYPSSSLDRNQQQCPNGCRNQGHCNVDTGKCQCFPGYLGHDCSENVCPVFCGGHGQYLQGSCRCTAGWKGRECTVRVDECEVADCSGNGVCIEGACQCRMGFKGEHCDLADCLDPLCSERGVCFEGTCLCKVGWSGANCSQPDSRLHSAFLPNCSRNGVYDVESGRCLCYEHYTGADCSQLRCSLDCGPHGLCEDGRCRCDEGWSGPLCRSRQCDVRCAEHGRCQNGSCVCAEGWMGRHCTLDGCPNGCSKHGRCVSTTSSKLGGSFKQAEVLTSDSDHHHHQKSPTNQAQFWSCRCDEGWGGADCSSSQETNCNDEIDNDNDGLVDCADSECCRHESCHQSLMCITSPDPLDILLRKQPPSPISSFFTKVHFLIEDGSVQSYAQKDTYSEKRVSVIRGQVVSREFNGLIGVRVSVTTEPTFGFTLTRSGGWFDILVNGGGMVTLQFQRNPLYPIKKELYVAWNEVAVIQNPVIMYSVPESSGLDGGPVLGGSSGGHLHLPSRAFSYSMYSHFLLPGFDLSESNWSLYRKLPSSAAENNAANNNSTTSSHWCAHHDYENLRPSIESSSAKSSSSSSSNIWLAKNSGTVCATPSESCILAESQAVHERIPIGGSRMRLVFQSSMAAGYLSTVTIRLTQPGSPIPAALRFILVRLLVEGTVQERILEADAGLQVTFSWNKRNVYKQKVYGFVPAKLFVGYLYAGCPSVVWSGLHTKLRGFDMEISELGGWNLDVHHRYNHFDGLLQRGDGQVVNFREGGDGEAAGGGLFIEPIAGKHMQPRPFASCLPSDVSCGSSLSSVRFFGLTSLTAAPDGSLYVGDGNLIRRISADGRVQTVYAFKQLYNGGGSGGSNSGGSSAGNGASSGSGSTAYEYYLSFNSLDGCLYISDPERLQIVRLLLNDQKQFESQPPGQQQQQQYQSDGVGSSSSILPEVEVVIGTGERCLPHDRAQCGDGKQGPEVTLAYPKGLAFGLDGSLFFADGSVIRVMDAASGVVRRLVGDGGKAGGRQQQQQQQQWAPASARPSSSFGCLASRPANEMRLHWPTSLSVSPLDGALYFVDSFVVFKLSHQLQVSIVAGLPAYCAEEASTTASGSSSAQNSSSCHSSTSSKTHHRFDARHFSACGEDILFGAITFTPSGTLYASDISRQSENRVYALHANGQGTLVHVAGFRSSGGLDPSRASGSHANCSVERCTDIGGHNCTCLITSTASSEGASSGTPKDTDYTDSLTDLTLGISARLFSVSGLAATGDGSVYIADEGSLRLLRLGPFSPVPPTVAPLDSSGDSRQIKIISPNRLEMYNFNRHGQHVSTRSTASGRTLFTFHYSQESASPLGRLTDVVDAAGTRLTFLRDPTGALHSIESSAGFKAQTAINKAGLLEAIGRSGGGVNGSLLLDYYPTTGLLRSKVDTTAGGATSFYLYNGEGRVVGAVSPTGAVTSIAQSSHLAEHQPQQQTVTVVSASTSSPFASTSDQQSSSTFQVSVSPSTSATTVRLVQSSEQITAAELTVLSDGSLLVNGSGSGSSSSPRHLQAAFAGKPSKLSRAMLPMQAQMFPLIAHARVEGDGGEQLLDLSLDYGLKMKSNIIGAVEKYVVVGGGDNSSSNGQSPVLALKMEYDWKANREIYYNGSQRPILYLQFDEGGRPIQWVPNLQPRAGSGSGGSGNSQQSIGHWPAHSISYDKSGQLAGWQDGTRTVSYSRDRIGRLVEVRGGQGDGHFVRYSYGDEGTAEGGNGGGAQQHQQLPSSVTLRSGHKYHFDLDASSAVGRLKGIITPKGTRHDFSLKILLGSYRFAYCPPVVESKLAAHSTANCYLTYFGEDRRRPVMSVLPYDHGKVVYRYGQRSSVLLPKEFAKEVGRTTTSAEETSSFPLAVDQVLFGGGGATERWYDRKAGVDLRGVWRSGSSSSSLADKNGIQDYSLLYKYARNSGQLKHLSVQFGGVGSQLSSALSTLTYSYRYDGQSRLRAIQAKLGGVGSGSSAAINLPSLEFTYNSESKVSGNPQLETMAAFRYFERSANESLLGDGVALYVKRFEPSSSVTSGKRTPLTIRHASLTIADKEVFRVDYTYESSSSSSAGGHHLLQRPLLTQTRTYMRHHHQLIANGGGSGVNNGNNKMRLQNFTYDSEGQLVEVQGREHWRFVYDFNGNLVTFLYLGNRIDIDYDSADRVRNFGKGTEHGGSSSSSSTSSSSSSTSTSSSGSSPYITDLRGFVVQRGDEQLRYNSLGQLLSSTRQQPPNRHQIDYTYDYRGRLVVRRDQAGNVTQFFYGDPARPHLVTHALSAGGQVISLLYDDVDDSLLSVRLNGGGPASSEPNSVYYVVCDQSRSPLLVFDARGSVVKELHRSPYGHVLFDSNPAFYLPVDFQGGIADPLTNLVHFPAAAGRVYDTLTGRWMTPVLDPKAFLLQRNLVERPRLLHQYQFNGNDPISGGGEDLLVGEITGATEDSILSTGAQFAERLRSSTSSLIAEADPSLGPLKLLSQLQELLPADLVQGKSGHEHSSPLVRSQHFTSLAFIIDELRQFASFKTGYFSKLTQEDNWTLARSMWRLIVTDSVLGFGGSAGVLLAKSPSEGGGGSDHHQLQVLAHSRVNGLLVEFLNRAVNGSVLLDVHLVMAGQDHFYLVHEALPDSHSLAQLKSNKYAGVLAPGAVNYTVTTGELEKRPYVDVRISLDTVVLNVRFGTTMPKERERVLRLAKKYSLLTRLSQERMALLQGHLRTSFSGSNQWTEEEKQFILSPDRHASQLAGSGGSSPLKADYHHSPLTVCPQLADDATNIVLKSRRSHN